MRHHEDDRRNGFFDLFPTPEGDVNVMVVRQGSISAWHRHQQQTDYFFVASGTMRFRVCETVGQEPINVTVTGPSEQVVAIQPNVWHGYQNVGESAAIVVHYMDRKFNEETPDEERAAANPALWQRVVV